MHDHKGGSSREAPSHGHGGMMSNFFRKTDQHTTTHFPPSPISPDDDGYHTQQYGAFDQGPAVIPTQMLPTPDTPTTRTYFQGSHDPMDFIIDLMHTQPEDFEPDTQAYLECMGRYASGQPVGYAVWPGVKPQDGQPQSYQPDLALVSSGLNFVRDQYARGSPGFWVQPNEITPADMQRYPHYPWMGALMRKAGNGEAMNEQAMLGLQHILEDPLDAKGLVTSQYLMVPGNIRIAIPSGLLGPAHNNGWLAQIGDIYGNSHPVWSLAIQPWYKDENLNDLLRYCASRYGEKTRPPLNLPEDPDISNDE